MLAGLIADTAALGSCWWVFGWKAALVMLCAITCINMHAKRIALETR